MRQVSVTIEYLIYLYIFICICLMGFNTWFLVVRKRRNRVLDRRSQKLFREIRSQMNTDSVSKKHLEHLEKNMKKYRFLMAFDRAVEMLKQEEPEAAAKYLDEVMPVFQEMSGYGTGIFCVYHSEILSRPGPRDGGTDQGPGGTDLQPFPVRKRKYVESAVQFGRSLLRDLCDDSPE